MTSTSDASGGRDVPDYTGIRIGSVLLLAIGLLLLLAGVLAIPAGIYALGKRGEPIVPGFAPPPELIFGLAAGALVAGSLTVFVASLGAAVRDMARNSYRR